MFWRFGGYANVSSLDSILDKPDVTVEDLLDESDLIQELKQQNSKLIEFLRDEPVLKKLLNYVVADKIPEEAADKEKHDDSKGEEVKSPGISFFGKGKVRSRSKSVSKKGDDGETEQDKQEAQRKKYAYVACEVLSSEVWSITEAVVSHRDYLREFWQYMHRPAPLDPLQAGYFTKVNETLLDKKTEEMLAFFKSLEGIVPAMLQHVDCPMVMDLLLKIISLEKHEGGAGIVDWLQSQNLIPLLLDYLSPEHNSATQTSAGDFLKAIITISANATTQDQSVIGPNELTRQLVSEPCIHTLISEMLRGGNALTVGVGIVIEVIRKNNSDYDTDSQVGPEPKTSDPIYLGTLLRQFANHIPDFMNLIRSSSARKSDLRAAFGGKIEPLGFDRFKTCELMAELLHCSNMALLNERGAEEEVRKRDAERERLKMEGKLATPRAPVSASHETSLDEFGSSVDSHGFHHAERPTEEEMSEKPVEIRKLEVQNASDEDGYEKVNPRDADDLPDEVSFDELNEKVEQTGLPALEKVDKRGLHHDPARDPDMPRPLSPNKSKLPSTEPMLHFDPPPTHAADSPTSAGVTDQVQNISMDEDTVMTEFGEEPDDVDDDGPSELEKELAKEVEKPAPLFARKEPPSADTIDPIHGAPGHSDSDELNEVEQSTITLQGEEGPKTNGERTPYETEADGSPVVGDLLKMRFVEHQVVPTILDFFFRFPWNNFLHNVVYDVVQQVFNGTLERGYNRTVAFDLFASTEGKDGVSGEGFGLVSTKDITDRILDGQAASDRSQAEKGMRLGYMGHLTLIAEEVCKFGHRQPLDQVVYDRVQRPEWTQYVDGTLTETRERDNAVLGGVRPETAIGMRQGSIGPSAFGSNIGAGLASAGIGAGVAAQDSLAMSEGTIGQSFEINSGTMLSRFGDGDDDEDMEDEERTAATADEVARERVVAQGRAAFPDDEQADSSSARSPESTSASIPPPLSIPPSRARRQLAARLAEKRKHAEGADKRDPDATDALAVETADRLAQQDGGEGGLGAVPPPLPGLTVASSGTNPTIATASKFSGLFNSDDSSDEDDEYFDEEEAGRDHTLHRAEGDYEDSGSSYPVSGRRWEGGAGKPRRPSTTEAKVRQPLDDDDDEDDENDEDGDENTRHLAEALERRMRVLDEAGEGPFADPVDLEEDDEEDSDDDEVIEIRPRRTS